MSSATDAILQKRFYIDPSQLAFQKVQQPDGTEIEFIAKRIGLTRADVLFGQSSLQADRLRELVKAFHTVSLGEDDVRFEQLQVAGRSILYSQLAEAYAFGLACFSSIYNQSALVDVLNEHGLTKHAGWIVNLSRYNKWNAITALLYGKWEAQSGGEDAMVYRRDRSAEKYGCVLAWLDLKKVSVCDVVDYINGFKFTDASGDVHNRAVGVEKAYRAKVAANKPQSKGPTEKQIAHRQRMIQRGENPLYNPDVFEMSRPAKLKESIEYGQMVFRKSGKKLFVVEAKGWEQADYEKFVRAIGQKSFDLEQDVLKRENDDKATRRNARSTITTNVINSDVLDLAIKTGISQEQLVEAMMAGVKSLLPEAA